MDIFVKSVFLFYQFLRSGDQLLIVTRSWMSWQCFGMLFKLWNALQLGFQFSKVLWKFAIFVCSLYAIFRGLGLGHVVYMYLSELGQENQPKVHPFMILIFDFQSYKIQSFSIFLPWNSCQLWKILSLEKVHEIFSS